MRRATFKAFLAALIVAVIAAILVAQRPSSADAVVTPTIPANVELMLGQYHGTTVRIARETDVDAAGGVIKASAAIEEATQRFTVPPNSSPAAYLGFFTNRHSGLIDDEGGVQPTYSDRLAWLVVIPNFKRTSSGGFGGKPKTITATLVVFLDATNGDFLFASGSGS